MPNKFCGNCGRKNQYEVVPPAKCQECNKEFFYSSSSIPTETRPTYTSNNFRATYEEKREDIIPQVGSLSISIDNELKRGIRGSELVGQGSTGGARPNRAKPLSKKQYAEKLKQFEQSFISKVGMKTNIDDKTIE